MATATENRINTHVAKKILRNAFAKNPNPSEQELERIAERCARPTYAVAKWFEKERDKTKSLQPAVAPRTSQLANSSTSNASPGAPATGNGSATVQRTNGTTSDRTQHDENWDQYAPPRAADVPNVALGNELKHNLDVAMGLFYLTTLGQPMTFASEPR